MGIFKKKVEFEDEKVPVSNGIKFITAVVIIVAMFVCAYRAVELIERHDIKHNNPTEYVEDM